MRTKCPKRGAIVPRINQIQNNERQRQIFCDPLPKNQGNRTTATRSKTAGQD